MGAVFAAFRSPVFFDLDKFANTARSIFVLIAELVHFYK